MTLPTVLPPGPVGFDLDMTLVDSRAPVGTALRLLAEETGAPIDVEAITAVLGPPIQQPLAAWFGAAEMPGVVARYRELLLAHGVARTTALPGAAEVFEACRGAGRPVVVVTAKNRPSAVATLAAVDLEPDVLVGDLWAEGKGAALREHHVALYVGDHPGDMAAAGNAGIPGIGVTTGGTDAAGLLAAGAAGVIASLAELAAALRAAA